VATTKSVYGVARVLLLALGALLMTGTAGSITMGIRAADAAQAAIVAQARAIADNSLTLVFSPEDVLAPAETDRAVELTQRLGPVVTEPSDFSSVMLLSPDGRILYSTDISRIGDQVPNERDRIRSALRGEPQTRRSDGRFSVMTGFRFPSGVGSATVVDLTRSDAPIDNATSPWRMMTLFTGAAMLFVVGLLFGLRQLRTAVAQANLAALRPQGTVTVAELNAEVDMRRKVEDRLRTAEERGRELEEHLQATTTERARWDAERRGLEADKAALNSEKTRLAEQRDALEQERDRLVHRVAERPLSGDPEAGERLRASEAQSIRLRAELEGAQTQLNLTTKELETARLDLLALRDADARAAMLSDEVRAARTEAESLRNGQRNEVAEREADFEQRMRATREEFQNELAQIETSFRDQLGRRESELGERISRAEAESRSAAGELETAQLEAQAARSDLTAEQARARDAEAALSRTRAEAEQLRSETIEHRELLDRAGTELQLARKEIESLRADMIRMGEELASNGVQLESTEAASEELVRRVEVAEHDARVAAQRLDQLGRELDEAAADNAELNRRLQEVQARRALEIANQEGRADIDDLLRITQERLSGQTEKLMSAEDRIHELEREVGTSTKRVEEAEAELRQQQMSASLRQMRETAGPEDAPVTPAPTAGVPLEDRRASSPFLKELSMDANKSLSRILGITQIMKHKRDAKDQAQLIKQLTAYARRLDHTVRDLADADRLARGTIQLQVKRTDLEALVQRVVEESGIGSDRDVRVVATPVGIGIDQLRTEQIVAGLLRNASDRTAAGKPITVRLAAAEGGAMISVEDPEPASDAAMSPVVTRFAEVQGGWAKVEGREGGGSVFSVFLPDASPLAARPPDPDQDLQVLVGAQDLGPSPEQILVQELHWLSELTSGED
jgi:chromosome segregation ATPase